MTEKVQKDMSGRLSDWKETEGCHLGLLEDASHLGLVTENGDMSHT